MHNVLVVDFSIYKNSLSRMFASMGYYVETSESAFDAIAKLHAFDFDLVVAEIELPGDNAFDLYNYIRKNYPYIPVIMTTEKNIDGFFDNIFREGIGNVICKPVQKEYLLALADKLITKKNIFGIANYLPGITETQRARIGTSRQISPAIKLVISRVKDWGFEINNETILALVLNEMLINAVYHSHGLTKEKLERKPVKLPEGSYVDFFIARSEKGYGISINDYNGKLTRHKILESIQSVIYQNHLIEMAVETGEDIHDKISDTGRGIDLVRRLSADYYFIIKQNVRTEIILLFDRIYSEDNPNFSSLKIIEAAQ